MPTRDYDDWITERLQDDDEAVAYLEALCVDEGDGLFDACLMTALKQVARAKETIMDKELRERIEKAKAYLVEKNIDTEEALRAQTNSSVVHKGFTSGDLVSAFDELHPH